MNGDSADKMAIAGGTLVALAYVTRGNGGGNPPPSPSPAPVPVEIQQDMRDASGEVTTIGRTLFGANRQRVMVAIVNDGDYTIYVCLKGTPAVNTGIRLNANGGNVIIDAQSMWWGAISAIAESSASKVTAVEVFNQVIY